MFGCGRRVCARVCVRAWYVCVVDTDQGDGCLRKDRRVGLCLGEV